MKLQVKGSLVALGAVLGAALCGASVFAARPYLAPFGLGDSGESSGNARIPASRLQCLTAVSPRFPSGAGFAPVSVLVEVSISRSGSVAPVRMVSGPRLFEADAMDAVRLWRFRPYLVDGVATPVITTVEVTFAPGKPGGLVSHPGS